MCYGVKEVATLKSKIIEPTVKSAFKVGDTVKITRKAVSHENGWDNIWVSGMDKAIGKIGVVKAISNYGIRVKITGVETFYYPEFILALSKGGYAIGDRVQVKASRQSERFSLEPATVIGFEDGYSDVLIKITTDKGQTGSFYTRNIEPLPVNPSSAVKTSKSMSKSTVFTTAQILAISLAKSNGLVNADQVQDALAGKGYTSTDLGNAAGALFRGKAWKKTSAVKSTRPGNNGRTIQNWQYVGA